jgi:alcohol dehydrogenase YqhD (iron-dependent ADH family)
MGFVSSCGFYRGIIRRAVCIRTRNSEWMRFGGVNPNEAVFGLTDISEITKRQALEAVREMIGGVCELDPQKDSNIHARHGNGRGETGKRTLGY